jgi:hypothetical protein
VWSRQAIDAKYLPKHTKNVSYKAMNEALGLLDRMMIHANTASIHNTCTDQSDQSNSSREAFCHKEVWIHKYTCNENNHC